MSSDTKRPVIAALCGISLALCHGEVPPKPADADNFYRSDAVVMCPVEFTNQYGMKLGGNLYLPRVRNSEGALPAVIVSHPMGAVKEQSANLYATKLAERGFATLSIDLTFWGSSEGTPRNAVSPDLYAESFSAACDYLRTLPMVDRERIGALGICGSGSFALSAAKIDSRIKAVATVSMYDMGQANRNALKKSLKREQLKAIIHQASLQRDVEYAGGAPLYTSGTVHEITEKSTPIEVEFYSYYRTARGEVTPPGATPKTTTHPTLSSNTKFVNFYPFEDLDLISPRPVLFITGSEAHSREFSEDAYAKAAQPKELLVVKGAGHVDLYDRTGMIPFDAIEAFFRKGLSGK